MQGLSIAIDQQDECTSSSTGGRPATSEEVVVGACGVAYDPETACAVELEGVRGRPSRDRHLKQEATGASLDD
jgi:hypothetical protein